MAFVREKQQALRTPKVSEAERRVGEGALLEVLGWLHGKTEEQLEREEPLEVYLRFKEVGLERGRREKARQTEVEGEYGGHIEVWFRSAQHPEGKTRLTAPLQEELRKLERLGGVTVRYFP